MKSSSMATPHSGSTPATVSRAPAKGDTPTAPGTVTTPGKPNGGSVMTMNSAGLQHGTVTGSGHGGGHGDGGSGK